MASVGTLAAGVAHEINNPLAYVISNLEFAVAELAGVAPHADVAEVTEALGEAREGAHRVRQIVRDLKTFSRADAERRGPVDVNAVLNSTVQMALNEIKHRAQLVRELSDVPPVEADESRLAQVFLNLLVNATQALPAGQTDRHRIWLRSRREGGRVIVEVQDTGPGLPEDVIHRVFDPFFTTKPVGEGTGLGLAICHGIVSSLGGEIHVENVPEGGALFRVTLPAMSAVPEAVEAPASAPLPAPPLPSARVLVVDDEPLIGRTIGRHLEGLYVVEALTSARSALARVGEGERFDVVLCDLMMPELSGMDLHAEMVRVAPEQADRMVFMTGGAFTRGAETFLSAPGRRRLDKPFSPEALREVIDGVLASA
jgi:CheY-like chemotaxis protein/anti-sigma regulatory factor (Ser/Thr protein kinase)